MITAIVAIVAVAAIGLVLLVVLSACTVSGRISELERGQEAATCPGFARGGETGQNEPENGCPIDNNPLSLGQTGIEDDNAD